MALFSQAPNIGIPFTTTFQRSGTLICMPPKAAVNSKKAPSLDNSASLKSKSIPPKAAVALPPLKAFETYLFSNPENIPKWLMVLSLYFTIPPCL